MFDAESLLGALDGPLVDLLGGAGFVDRLGGMPVAVAGEEGVDDFAGVRDLAVLTDLGFVADEVVDGELADVEALRERNLELVAVGAEGVLSDLKLDPLGCLREIALAADEDSEGVVVRMLREEEA